MRPLRPWRVAACILGLVCVPVCALAQAQGTTAAPPGPYVIDVRGATMGLPEEGEFYPPLPSGALIPARGFGLEAGAHLYLGRRLGPARLGVGASFAYIRGATDDTSASSRLLAPQLSFNFGTSEGWSYLSGGAGVADITGRVSGMEEAEVTATRSGFVLDLNVGGGARWFITRHVAVGFDLRLHRLGSGRAEEGVAGTPSTMLLLASAGLSLK